MYVKAGTYTAKLLLTTLCGAAACASSQATVVGTATITVSEKENNGQQKATSTPAVSDSEKNKDKKDNQESTSTVPVVPVQQNATTSPASPAPTCNLAASNASVSKNTEVSLTWTSTNATYASSQSGEKGPAQGSIKFKMKEDTLFIKKVYGLGGMGTCQVMVQVSDDNQEGTPAQKIVVNTEPGYFNQLFSSMQLGAVVVAETYGDFLSGRAQ